MKFFSLIMMFLVPCSCTGQIKHEWLCVDNAKNNLVYVNQFDSSKNWVVKIPAGSRDLQIVRTGVVLVGHGNGCGEYDISTGQKLWAIGGHQGIQSARRLTNGHFLLANDKTIVEVDREGRTIKHIPIKGLKLQRLMRVLENGHFLRTSKVNEDYVVVELDTEGNKVWQANLTGKGYLAQRLKNGNTLATTGKTCSVIEISPDGLVVKSYAGRDTFKQANLKWFSGFHLQDNGNIAIANWLGHGQQGTGPHLVEFSSSNKLIWSWTDHEMAQQITNVYILK